MLANRALKWERLRTITSRRSSPSSDRQLRSSSPAETGRGKSPGAANAFHEAARRPAHRIATSADGVDLDVASPHLRQRSQDRKTDPLGLVSLYTPEVIPVADVIFLHGLGGTSRQTWSKNRDSELFWPQNWLPLETEISRTRIFSFGYNAHFSASGPNSIASISDFAKSLLFAMKFGNGKDIKEPKIGSVRLMHEFISCRP